MKGKRRPGRRRHDERDQGEPYLGDLTRAERRFDDVRSEAEIRAERSSHEAASPEPPRATPAAPEPSTIRADPRRSENRE